MEYIAIHKLYLTVGITIGIVKQMTEIGIIAADLAVVVDIVRTMNIHGKLH